MNRKNIILTLALLLFGWQLLSGQTTISNIPSTDVIEPRSFYGEVNFGGHFSKYETGGFQTYGVKSLYGLTRNVEIGANFTYTRNGADSPVEFGPNVKWKAFQNEKHKVAVTGGLMAFIPVRAAEGSRPIAMVYANASKGFDFAKGFRLTGGFYQLVGAKAGSGNRKGAILGYEQTVYKKISFFADWTSGKNRFGYAAAGLSIPLSKRNIIYAGYNFGNGGRGNNWFNITFGRFF
ncbi:MAG: hypothetical protein JSS81_00890 [Acidobacteria bacterium]|nr:hypothetical protein [Acidobacteriota bacterium]